MSLCFRLCNLSIKIFLLLIIFDYNNVIGESRGGSRGGGGYRSGSSRTNVKIKVKVNTKPRYGGGYKRVSYTKIGYSPSYSTWTSRHGFSPSFRYRTSSYIYKSRGISMGLIFMSHRHRSTFIIERESSYNDISICYNEFPLYDRNVTASPWFVCPWDDPRERFCCGDELEEKCCAYFDRSGNVAGLVVGLLVLIILFISIIVCCCCCKRKKHRSEMVVIVNDSGAVNKQEQITLMPPDSMQYNPIPPNVEFPQANSTCAPYPMINDYSQPQPEINCPPYPPVNTYGQEYPPYPINPPNPVGYDQFNQQNPPIPTEKPPPSYSDLVRN